MREIVTFDIHMRNAHVSYTVISKFNLLFDLSFMGVKI